LTFEIELYLRSILRRVTKSFPLTYANMAKEEEIREAFGKAVKELRLEKVISQEKLAEYANLDRSYISLIERGINSASVITLFKISSALDIDPIDLITKTKSHLE